ncbi:Rap1a/Tai family immunity protein [Methylomonas sp. BW4-1]|uniref:Rap1a/Tai family immunity protein n=1 Tax=unclassified Methylomonas TaxID=2608980 RepID=UPI00051C7332|nr:Rap1a/Tai family immunity protein [Methylomonas sp. LW13]QBC26982.1 hypothetical protein U737_08720 [Methylomonas sp. LW13]
MMKFLTKLTKISCALIMSTIVLCECAYANANTPKINEDSVDLQAKIFLDEFVSSDSNTRKAARLYLLGVLDATEGRVWCGFKTLKTATLNEFIFEHMKKLEPTQLERRASVVIEESLKKSFPCREKP